MQKTLLFLSVLSLLFTACNKEDDTPAAALPLGSFTATVDGTRVSHNIPDTPAQGLLVPFDGGSVLTINGGEIVDDVSYSVLTLILYVEEQQELTRGEYSFTQECFLEENFEVCAFFGYARSADPDAEEVQFFTTDEGSVNLRITEIDYRSGGFITAEFDGTIVDVDTGETLSVTKGAFKVEIIE